MLIPTPNRWEAEATAATSRFAFGPKLCITPRAFEAVKEKSKAMPFCTNCGHENPEGSNFCGQCGSALIPGAARAATPEKVPTGDTTKAMPAMVEERDTDSLTAEDEAAVNALPHGSALLIVQRGANAGSRFLLDTDLVTVGRHQDSDIFLDDISVSRRHATFTRTPEGTWSRTWAVSTAPTSTETSSTNACCGTVTRCRSASSAWSTSGVPGARNSPRMMPNSAESPAGRRAKLAPEARRIRVLW